VPIFLALIAAGLALAASVAGGGDPSPPVDGKDKVAPKAGKKPARRWTAAEAFEKGKEAAAAEAAAKAAEEAAFEARVQKAVKAERRPDPPPKPPDKTPDPPPKPDGDKP
jgi:hypothetical protein